MPTHAGIVLSGTMDVPTATRRVSYSPRLVRTTDYMRANPNPVYFHDGRELDFYDTLKVAADMAVANAAAGGELFTLSDAGEEQHVYVLESPHAHRLRDAEGLRDYFGNNDGNWCTYAHTLTGLRFREDDVGRPHNIGDEIACDVIVADIIPYLSQITDPRFARENWKDIINNVNTKVGERRLPYARGQVIEEMDVLGIWKSIRKSDAHPGYALHAWLRKNLEIPKDSISGHNDVAVGRGGGWLPVEGCLVVDAGCWRWGAGSVGGFRPVVRGSLEQR